MAIFRKISNGLEMQGCDLYHYLLTNKGYCCEKGWNWEDLDTSQIMQGRQWLSYWQQYGSPCPISGEVWGVNGGAVWGTSSTYNWG